MLKRIDAEELGGIEHLMREVIRGAQRHRNM
jgi:hypothetical protein